MSVLDISYTIIFDDEKKISYKKLGVYYKNNNVIQDISAIFVIKPSNRYNNYLKNTDLSFNKNEYDLSFSNTSYIEFTDILKNDGKLLPGKWSFGYRKDYSPNTADLLGIKSVFLPYRDFLYDNDKPLIIRDEINYNKLFVNITHLELLKFYNNNKLNFFSLGKDDIFDSSGNADLQIFLDFILWFPEDETSINLSKSNTWSLPDNYLGIVADKRISETPTYHTDQNGNITLYENLSNFNEPGFRYDNASNVGKRFYINYVSKMKLVVGSETFYKNNINSQYYLIQINDNKDFTQNPTVNFLSIDGGEATLVDDWELEIYILNDSFLENIEDPAGVFSYSNTPNEKDGILFGIRGDGDDTGNTRDLSGSKSYIFRDKDGKPYHANLELYGVTKTGNKYNGGFTIRYKIRKKTTNEYDVYIFINDNFVTKIDNGGCKLNDINYWGLPVDGTFTSNHMIKSVSRVFESKLSTSFNNIFQDKSIVTWSKNVPITKKKILNSNLNNQKYNFTTNDAIIFTDSGDVSGNYSNSENYSIIFDAGANNKFYLDIINFNFTFSNIDLDSDKLSLFVQTDLSSNVDSTNWIKHSEEWMIKETATEVKLDSNTNNTIYGNSPNETYPILFKDNGGDTNYTWSQDISNSEIVFDTNSTEDFEILIKSDKLGLGANENTLHGNDQLSIEYSIDNITWIIPNLGNEFLQGPATQTMQTITLNNNQNNGEIFDLDNTGTINFKDNLTGNYQNNQNVNIVFKATGKISIKIEDFQFENNYDYLRIYYSTDGSTWNNLNFSWMKNNKDYNSGNFGGNYFPNDISLARATLGIGNENIYINTNYSWIKFTFYSDGSVTRRGWDMILYKTPNKNIFPATIANNITIKPDYRYIKFKFKFDNSTFEKGWEILLNGKNKNGNIFPENKESAIALAGVQNFEYIKSIIIDYRYLKFNFKSNVDGSVNSGWEIIIKNSDSNLYNIELSDDINNKMFAQTKGLINYPVSFKNNSSNIWTLNEEYNYTFDAGDNNTINFHFIDFSFNQIATNNSSPGNANELLGSTMSISLSDDNINWVPMNTKWMHKTNNYIGNTIGGYLPSFYSDFYYQGSGTGGGGGNLINSQVWKNWIDDINGFVLPKNKYYAENMAGDISWNNINKVKTDYRYAKIKYKPSINNDKSSWDIRIFIKEDIGFEKSILSNYSNINIDSGNNQIESICYELDASTINKTSFPNSNKYSKNNYQIPYIARYDYKLQDNSNNIILKSQLDKDILYDINDKNYNYNCKRTMKEIDFLPKTITSLNDAFSIRQKYNYSNKLLNDSNSTLLPYIPGKAEINFINTNNTVIITIPNSQIIELKDSLINYWRGKDYPTYVNFILYIWYPWTDKYLNYNTSELQAGLDLSNNLNIQGCDEIISLNMSESTYYTINQVGIPDTTAFNFTITQFSGRYLFSWSYQVFQPSGIYNNQTPFENLKTNNKNYTPNINILNIKDFVKDDFIYDPQQSLITYIPSNQDISFNKITISLSNSEIINFNKNIKRHRRSLTSQNCDISSVEIKFYVWTPNNEKDTNPEGWELPSDYYGVNEQRIISTPYRFPSLQYGITNINWDPQYILNGITEFGYNIDSSGIIIKTFDISSSSNFYIGDISGNQKIEFDISYDMIYFHPNDTNNDKINKTIPNPYKYKKNSIFGIPYLSRWDFKIYEDLSFKNSLKDSISNVLIKPITSSDISYNGQYPVLFKDDNGDEEYSDSYEGVQVFDAGIDKTISLFIQDFKFKHQINADNTANYNDRLALLTSDLSGNDLSFNPVQISWMHKSSLYQGDISGEADSNFQEYYNDENGFIFPKDKLTAVRNYKSNSTETNENDFENLSLHLIATNKRYAKFRFISNESLKDLGWVIKVFTSEKNPINIIESRVKLQEGNIGNTDSDFNFKFNFNSDYYLELDKSIKNINTGILDFKDFINTGIYLGFQKKKSYLIIKINDVLWQFVIKLPPNGYIFDYLDKNGNILGQLPPVGNVLVGPNNNNLKATEFGNSLFSTMKFDDTNLLFDETVSSTTLDGGRKYILYIRKSTNSEKIFFNKFKKSTIVQFSNTEINSRLSDWYPLNINYGTSTNKYYYGTLFNTEEVVLEEDAIEEVKNIDLCGLCRTITKTKNNKNFNLRYADKVKINFKSASRIREKC